MLCGVSDARVKALHVVWCVFHASMRGCLLCLRCERLCLLSGLLWICKSEKHVSVSLASYIILNLLSSIGATAKDSIKDCFISKIYNMAESALYITWPILGMSNCSGIRVLCASRI